jgi:hypothetical protein
MSPRTAGDHVLLSDISPGSDQPSPTSFLSAVGRTGAIDLDQGNPAGNGSLDTAYDKRQLLMMLLMLRGAEGRYPFIVLR